MITKSSLWSVFFLAGLVISCGEEGGLKGTLKIAITDAPIDANDIKAVNVVVSNVEGFQNGKWKSFRYFEQPIGVNLLAYSGGKSVLLIDQFTSPGEYSSLRLSLNIAQRNSSLIVNPQSNIVFKNGSSAPLYMSEGEDHEIIIEKIIGIVSRGLTDITLDLDLRKSIQKNEQQEFVLKPVVRFIETAKAGSIKTLITNPLMIENVVAYVFARNTFNPSELADLSRGAPLFDAITSSVLKSNVINFGFLESGTYDLIFVKHDANGAVAEMLGRRNEIKVEAGIQTDIEVNLDQLGPS